MYLEENLVNFSKSFGNTQPGKKPGDYNNEKKIF